MKKTMLKEEHPWMDYEAVRIFKDQLQELEKPFRAADAKRLKAERARDRAKAKRIKSAIKAWSRSRDASGKLKYPEFKRLQRTMGALMEMIPALADMRDGPRKLSLAYQLAEAHVRILAPIHTPKHLDKAVKRAMKRSGL